jgi:hypothetical protein
MRLLWVSESLNVFDSGYRSPVFAQNSALVNLLQNCGQLQIRLKDTSSLLAVVEKDCNFGS